ncbi:HD domain-containing protein [Caldibacillus lycopersici]|uniref:HD domain-containing protein n=1 Tax=Perspicuibacillus lycopersici TaxID=1325689 RepID=A0AAE3LM31_9BACI|nr:HD domain-containing protein [Perspicuibacillus lycopersici]MCU9612521.1 HD domain-containing protein [Perspicuibacillus lycopersici]
MSINKDYFYHYIPVTIDVDDSFQGKILKEFPAPVLPNGEENFNIQEIEKGTVVKIPLLLNEFTVEKTKTDKQYLKIKFSNNSGVPINAKMWDNQDSVNLVTPLLEEYSIFTVEGKVEDYRGHKSLTIYKLQPLEDSVNPFQLLPYTKQSIEELTIELFTYLDELASPFKEIAYAAMRKFWNQFSIRPAAKGYHHNYLGGLLKHTVGLMRFARYILKHEENHYQATLKLINVVEKIHKRDIWDQLKNDSINSQQLVWKETIDHLYNMLYGMMQHKDASPSYDIVMTSILYHDLGKLLEYDHAGKKYDEFKFLYPTSDDTSLKHRKQTGIIMDALGVMIGHIPYGVLLLSKVIESESITITLEDIHQISHCILCHHGLPEWGACIRNPQTIEGFIVHIADFLDSRYENTESIK